MIGKPILCLDFDGVLHSYASGWRGAEVIPDPPVEGAKEFIEAALEHFEVSVFSSRSHQVNGRAAMMDWCAEHFGERMTEELHFPLYKPAAFLTIDDRAWTFDGRWPEPEALLGFKPWNKR